MYIEFKKITFKNVGTYGDQEQTIEFQKGLSLIVGKNGQGKSTIIQALNYALYGKPFTKVKIGSLINKFNNKQMLVVLEVNVDDDIIVIKRGLKPTVFEIYKNGNLLPFTTAKDYQKLLEQDILHMSENIFKQLVALGANVENAKHFMELTQKEKEEILQILTDTKIFSLIVDEIRVKKNETKALKQKEEIVFNMSAQNLTKTQNLLYDLQKQNEEVRNHKEQKLRKMQDRIEELLTKNKEIEEYNTKFEQLKIAFEPLFVRESELQTQINEINQKFFVVQNDIDSYKNSTEITCPECGASFKEIEISRDIEIEILAKELQKLKETRDALYGELSELQVKLQAYKEKLFLYNEKTRELSSNKAEIERLEQEIEYVKQQKEISTEETEKQIKELEKSVKEKGEMLAQYEKDINDYDMLEHIISIKNITGKIIDTQIPLLNTFINEYLEKFEVEYQFYLTKDLKEVIKRRDVEFEYLELSNGEKQRIVLSILFSFLRLIEMSVKINILFLDEFLDSSLDEFGTNLVLDILKEDFKEKNVFIITHKQQIKSIDDITNAVYQIKKDANGKFSYIEKT